MYVRDGGSAGHRGRVNASTPNGRGHAMTAAAAAAVRISDDELVTAARDLKGERPLHVLRWAAERFAPRLGFGTGFGVEGCMLIDIIGRHQLPIDFFTLDTGLFFEETYDLWRKLEARYDITIRAVRPELNVDQQAL